LLASGSEDRITYNQCCFTWQTSRAFGKLPFVWRENKNVHCDALFQICEILPSFNLTL
jgi:hypothetical protein